MGGYSEEKGIYYWIIITLHTNCNITFALWSNYMCKQLSDTELNDMFNLLGWREKINTYTVWACRTFKEPFPGVWDERGEHSLLPDGLGPLYFILCDYISGLSGILAFKKCSALFI